jgi:hypothetical protein
MAMRKCPVLGCPTLVKGGGRCTIHAAEARARKPERPNDAALKARLLPLWIGKPCPRCEVVMTQQDADAGLLDLGHSKDLVLNPGARPDRIEHAECNRRAGGQLSQQLHPLTER